MIKTFLKDLIQYAPAQVVPGVIAFITIPILTRLFLPEDYGKYILVIATVNILVTMVGWLPTSTIRFYSIYEKDNKLHTFYSTTIGFAFISIGLLIVLYLIAIWILKDYLPSKLPSLMLIGGLLFVAQAFFLVLQYFLRVKRKVNWYTTFSLWNSVASLCLGLLLVMVFHRGVEGLILGSFLAIASSLPFLWYISTDVSLLTLESISKKYASEMAHYGLPLVVVNLAAWILSLSDRYILEFFRGSNEVGIYSASYGIAEKSILLISTLFMLASGPIVMNIWEKDGEKACREFITKLTRYFLLVCLPATVGLSVLAKPLISILTPQKYHEGFMIIPFVSFGAFFLGLQQCFQTGLTFHKKTSFIMLGTIIAGLLNLGLNFLLVPKHGYMGAAVATLISYVFLFAVMVMLSRKYFVWDFPFKSLWKITTASVIMALVVYLMGKSVTSITLINLFLCICIGSVIYLIMFLLLREFNNEEIKVLYPIGKILRRKMKID
jgi:O-antigen/teichoic acid export membrane protein